MYPCVQEGGGAAAEEQERVPVGAAQGAAEPGRAAQRDHVGPAAERGRTDSSGLSLFISLHFDKTPVVFFYVASRRFVS